MAKESGKKPDKKKPSLPATPLDLPRVNIDIFEGPLDLLLYLIRKNEYDIFDIPIVSITEQYLKYIEVLKDLNLEIAGEFLVMAATLMKIKSRLLLPRPPAEDEEEGEDPRAALVRQLLEYQKYREAAQELSESAQLGRDVFARNFPSKELKSIESEESSYLEVDVYQLIEALRSVLNRLPEKSEHIIHLETFSVCDRINSLVEFFKGVESIMFENLFQNSKSRPEVIATFLALLEMIKMGLAKIFQTTPDQPIRIFSLISDETEVNEDEMDDYSGSGEGQ